MQSSSSSARHFGLSALIVLLLAFLNITSAAPITRKREDGEHYYGDQITQAEYAAYLRQYYPETDKYLLYSGGAEGQLEAFKNANPGYYYYKDFFDAGASAHYATAFPPQEIANPDPTKTGTVTAWRMDDGDASSRAIAETVRGKITVFGAAQWQTLFDDSFYATDEAPLLKTSMENGDLKAINHMEKGATSPDQIMATENAKGEYTYQNGFADKSVNNDYGKTCKRDGISCGASSSNTKPEQTSSHSIYGNPAEQVSHTGQTVDPGSNTNTDPGHTTTSDPHGGVSERPPQVGGHL